MTPFADRITTDMHGNCIAALHEAGRPACCLAGHVDELGFIVYIADDGYLYFNTIGGFDVSMIAGRRCGSTRRQGRSSA